MIFFKCTSLLFVYLFCPVLLTVFAWENQTISAENRGYLILIENIIKTIHQRFNCCNLIAVHFSIIQKFILFI